jgi:acid phosphatase type 7
MTAWIGSAEPFLLLACLALVCVAVWFFLRRRPHAREPRDFTAKMADTFIIKPYVQLGNHPRLSLTEQLVVLWQVKPSAANSQWALQARVAGSQDWTPAVDARAHPLRIAGIGDTVRCAATITHLPRGYDIEYRVLCDGDVAFISKCRTRHSRTQPYRFVVAGDLGEPQAGHEQRIAYRIHQAAPDFLVVPGDIVYDRGRVSEYMRNFFPVYNADAASLEKGAPILRSTVVIGAVGNHDMGMPKPQARRDFSRFDDLLGYYVFFSQPLDGPVVATTSGATVNLPWLEGDVEAQKNFLRAAGVRYPRMASFSFEWGNSFWLALDANAYMDWTDEGLRNWVDQQLKAASRSTWKFVTFHQPAFSSNGKHANEQRMRLLAPIFEENGVDVVFVGHVHCFERSRPMRFVPSKLATKLHTEDCPVDGLFAIDREYDGITRTRPDGVIYVTSGAGGAKIHTEGDPKGVFKEYTAKYDQAEHSFTVCDVHGRRLEVRQISEDGVEIDRFVIDK